jgi:hypothetical protein
VKVLVVLALLGPLGCNRSDGTVQVTGSVKYADGAAVTGESPLVLFEPVDANGKAASGSIKADGTFDLMTVKPGDGVKPGAYKVVLKVFKNYRAQTLAVPDRYGDAATTPLDATVDSGHTHFDFVVEK